MPSRILRESYATSESVASMEPGAQDRLPRYFLLADDFGAFLVNETVIAGRIFPLRPDMTPQRVAADLGEFQRAGILVVWTDDNGKRYAEFPNWFRHQRTPRQGTKRKTPERPSAPPAAVRSGPQEAAADAGQAQESAGSRKNPLPHSQSQSQASTAVGRAADAAAPAAESRREPDPVPEFFRLLSDRLAITAPDWFRPGKEPRVIPELAEEIARVGGPAAAIEAVYEAAIASSPRPQMFRWYLTTLRSCAGPPAEEDTVTAEELSAALRDVEVDGDRDPDLEYERRIAAARKLAVERRRPECRA